METPTRTTCHCAFLEALLSFSVATSAERRSWFPLTRKLMGNGRNTVSRVLFQRRELTEFRGKLGEFCEKLGEFALAHK